MRTITTILATLALGATVAQAQDVVRLGTEGAYPPYNFINDNNEIDGFEREFGDLLCERAQITCEWVINDWDTIIPNLVAGNYDVIIAGMAITEARSQIITFTQNYFPPDPSAYAALAGAEEAVLSGIVAAQSNTFQAGIVAETDATLIEFPTPDETVAAVRNGQADAVFADKAFLEPIVNASNGELVFVGPDLYPGEGFGLGTRQSDQALRDRLNPVITELKEDGSLNALIAKWFGDEVKPF